MRLWDWIMANQGGVEQPKICAPKPMLAEIVRKRVERSERQIRELEGRRVARVLEMYPR